MRTVKTYCLLLWTFLPLDVHAEEIKTPAPAGTKMHFMRLPPRQHHGLPFAQRNQRTALKPIVRPRAHADSVSDTPPSGDKHKLLLYVYDEIH